MDFCLSTLGCELPVAFLGRRRLSLKESLKRSREDISKDLSSCHRDSLLVYMKQYARSTKTLDFKEDDDTASTQSTSTVSEEEDSLGFTTQRVSFAEPLVTAVYTRPATTKEDKYYLHYNEHDYVDFKVEYITGKERCRKVSFEREVVSTVHSVAPLLNHEDLYYSEKELQQ